MYNINNRNQAKIEWMIYITAFGTLTKQIFDRTKVSWIVPWILRLILLSCRDQFNLPVCLISTIEPPFTIYFTCRSIRISSVNTLGSSPITQRVTSLQINTNQPTNVNSRKPSIFSTTSSPTIVVASFKLAKSGWRRASLIVSKVDVSPAWSTLMTISHNRSISQPAHASPHSSDDAGIRAMGTWSKYNMYACN